jgi:hypothetical protein
MFKRSSATSFVSYPGSERMLRDLVSTMDGDNVKQWRNMRSAHELKSRVCV